ncbi:hypothetical protein IMZ48_32375, partial [Candidatus Bathyarchaeota archaeon]|nr:hypothetical protein [Candidatus Bathyarchaeota archaeon]
MAQTPPLLFTKRLTGFLATHLSPTTHTLLLTTPTGRLLAHASSAPASALRARATVAAGLVRMYSRPATPTHNHNHNAEGEEKGPLCVTVQLEEGVFVVRVLRCGLLLVAVGPDEGGEAESVRSGSATGSASASRGAGVRRVGEEVGRLLEGRLGALRVP